MPARNQQHQVRKGNLIGQPGGQRVPRQMVHRHQRQPPRRCEPPRQHDARQHPADQSRSRCHCNRIKPVKPDPGSRKGFFHHSVQPLCMGPRRDFGHNAAECLMQAGLPQHLRRQNLWRRPRHQPHHRRCCIVAARFDAEEGQCPVHGRRCVKAYRQVTP